MHSVDIPIKRLRPQACLPCYMSDAAAGMDLFACLEAPVVLAPGERGLIPTGIAMAIPIGFEGQVRPRSGLALRQGVALVNSPGTIDADYRGEIGIIVINHGRGPVSFAHGDRIAQLVIAPVLQGRLQLVTELEETRRGAGGFGHTGVNGEKSDRP